MRKLTALALVMVFGFIAFGACGDDEEDKVEASPAQVDAAKNSVTAINAAKADPTNLSAVAGLYSLMGNAQLLLSATSQSESSLSRPLEGGGTECVSESNGTYTYDGCGTVQGTMTVSGDTVTFDLTLSVTGAGSVDGTDVSVNVGITLKGEVTASSDALKGTIDMATSVDASGTGVPGGATSATASVSVEYDVTLDSSGCPTGGTMNVSTSASGSSGGSSGSATASVTAEFGPACGDVALVVEAAAE